MGVCYSDFKFRVHLPFCCTFSATNTDKLYWIVNSEYEMVPTLFRERSWHDHPITMDTRALLNHPFTRKGKQGRFERTVIERFGVTAFPWRTQQHQHEISYCLCHYFCCVRIQEGVLDDGAWRSFTAIEVPEFEGYSSGKLPGSRRIAAHG